MQSEFWNKVRSSQASVNRLPGVGSVDEQLSLFADQVPGQALGEILITEKDRKDRQVHVH